MAEYNVDKMIRDIIDSSDNNWAPSDKIPLIIKEIDNLKIDMRTFLANSDFDIETVLNESGELNNESRSLVDELETCQLEMEHETLAEIIKSMDKHNQISEELDSVNFALNIINNVNQCGKYIKELDDDKTAQNFTKGIQCVYDMLQFVNTPTEGFEQLDLYETIKMTAQMTLDRLLHGLYAGWNEMVQCTVEPETECTKVSIFLNLEGIDILSALDDTGKLTDLISEFAQFLMKEVFTPILHNNCIALEESDKVMSIKVSQQANYRPTYIEVISNMKVVFCFLNKHMQLKFNTEKTIIKILGKLIGVEFCDMIVKECLIDTIPNNITDLQTYDQITSFIQVFQEELVKIKFFPNENVSLLSYLLSIDVIFANRSSQYFIESARSVMLKNLSLTMSIGVEKIPEDLEGSDKFVEEEHLQKALEILDNTFPHSMFFFPRCMISKTAQELLDLVYIVMEQAVQCSDIVSKKHYFTARYIFEMYDAVVPYHHENYLQTIPQYVALFHNNCMYLAHNLQTLGDKWLSLMEGRELDYAIGFVDLVQKMRELGYKHLTAHMQQQRKQILDNIRSSDLNCIVVKDVLGDNAEAAVRQCLRQLQLLKNVWVGVFPANVFTRLMATLTNMFIDELIHRVCTVEDISMEMATQLTDMYSLVLQKTPQQFQSPSDVDEHVKSWAKLRELIFVLGGSLKDIEARWGDGAGALARLLSSDEVRSLVKALFQNSQLRANLLAKIK